MMREDRSWMYVARRLPEFENGVIDFLNVSFSKTVHGSQIRCPCKRCKNRYWLRRDEVYDHLKAFGFVENYYVWTFHGEDPLSTESIVETLEEQPNFNDNTNTLLDDRFRGCFEGPTNVQNGPNDEAKKFYKLLEEGKQELFPGCKNFSKLSFIIRLFLYKTLHGISNVAFNDLLQLLRDMVPEAKIPVNFNEAKNIVRDLGLDYKKILACPNDCMLFWKEFENAEECFKCHASKWKKCEANSSNKTSNTKNSHQIPAKVLWHFPLPPRLQRVYMNSEIAEAMTWHADKCPKDGYLRHPADGSAWKDFDSIYPLFANEPRNVRLGLASDGFNPFRTMSVCHSTWPVVLVNYNLPPWMFMKPEYFMLSLLIPGPEGPGNNIDVYLQPLIEELKDLWNVGLETYDKFRNETFNLHAALTWTISDFPGNSMLSGWKTKGKFACPSCNHETDSLYLKHSKKMCYMGSRRFLDANDPLRRDKKSFNGKFEERPPPRPLTGFHVLDELSDFVNSFGKKEKQKNKSDCPWKKKSIFFELPYWKHNKCRHNLDVMHIEKNVFDNVLGTLLDISGKSKDHPNARFDLLDMGIKEDLQPQLSEDQRHVFFPKACYSMSTKEKDIFCRALKVAKLPYKRKGYLLPCFKSRFKKKHFYRYKDDKSRWQNRSNLVPDDDFLKLLAKWKKKSEKKQCSRNRDRRLAQKNMHTAGPKSFARIREELTNEDPDKQPPSLAKLFEHTRARKPGNKYKESYDDTEKKITEMKTYAPDDGECPTDPFLGVMGKEYDGRRRLFGRGVSNKKLKEVNGTQTSYVVPGEVLESLKTSLREDLRKDMDYEMSRRNKEQEQEYLKRKAELESMEKNIENQRDLMREQILTKFLERLPPDVVKEYLS